ncbi:MAG: polysaccharide biosynthesis tyrosine autokinase [Chloroflexi bacterium]|nr:polysaccharide biosynthesis tyrosine autokinase [Chloroflexota bacterium]MCL5026411.1 polysaccharide biosynthesis tyrosine autokinase [Chloroflexota bacterium]
MELRRYLEACYKWLWLMALGTILAGGVAYLVSEAMPPVYRASTTLLVNQPMSPLAADPYNAILSSERLTKTYAELVRKRPVLDEVNSSLGLPYTAERLSKMIDVQLIRDTQLFVLAVEHTDPQLARDIANKLAEVFVQQASTLYADHTGDVRERMDQQIVDVERNIQSTSQAVEALRGRASLNAEQQSELARLQATLSQYQTTYSILLKDREETRLNEIRTKASVLVAEPADVPLQPVKPRVLMNVLLAALVGLILAGGMAYLLEYLDDTVKTSEDIERVASLSTLGAIRRFEPDDFHEGRVILSGSSRSPLSEAYRVLRTNIQFSSLDKPLHSLLITSSNPSEGKTTTSVNLGVVLAQTGKKVILIDADLRRPSMHRFFGLTNSFGLTNMLLATEPDGAKLLQSTNVEGLSLLSSGPLPPNPSELLGSPRMSKALESLKGQADILVIDSPPVLSVTDPAVLATHADGVVLVVDTGRTRAEMLQRTVGLLARARANVMGAVLNKLVASGSGYYHHYYYYYYGQTGQRQHGQRRPGLVQQGRLALSGLFNGGRKRSS